MTLFPCSECSKQVSSFASACPHCGNPNAAQSKPPTIATQPIQQENAHPAKHRRDTADLPPAAMNSAKRKESLVASELNASRAPGDNRRRALVRGAAAFLILIAVGTVTVAVLPRSEHLIESVESAATFGKVAPSPSPSFPQLPPPAVPIGAPTAPGGPSAPPQVVVHDSVETIYPGLHLQARVSKYEGLWQGNSQGSDFYMRVEFHGDRWAWWPMPNTEAPDGWGQPAVSGTWRETSGRYANTGELYEAATMRPDSGSFEVEVIRKGDGLVFYDATGDAVATLHRR